MHRGFPIQHGDRLWKASEGLYHALRFPGQTEIHDAINACENAYEAKLKAYEYIDQTRPDWQDVKVGFMEDVLRLKIEQHSALDIILDLTFDLEIVEKSSKDDFWGAKPDGNGNLVGENVLGLLWMLIRSERRLGLFRSARQLIL